jgi:hypothetical protein
MFHRAETEDNIVHIYLFISKETDYDISSSKMDYFCMLSSNFPGLSTQIVTVNSKFCQNEILKKNVSFDST